MTPHQARLAQALGAILRSRRAWHMLTQADIAAVTGIPRTRVGSFERGRLVYDVWEATQLALLFQMPLEELLQPCVELVHTGTAALQEVMGDRADCTAATAEGRHGSALTNRPD